MQLFHRRGFLQASLRRRPAVALARQCFHQREGRHLPIRLLPVQVGVTTQQVTDPAVLRLEEIGFPDLDLVPTEMLGVAVTEVLAEIIVAESQSLDHGSLTHVAGTVSVMVAEIVAGTTAIGDRMRGQLRLRLRLQAMLQHQPIRADQDQLQSCPLPPVGQGLW